MLSLHLGLAQAKAQDGVECQHMKTLYPSQDEEVEWVSVRYYYIVVVLGYDNAW